MTLEEAIKHAEEKAAELREYSDVLSETSTTPKGKEISDCLECAEEHEQLAEWLKELKALKERPQGEWIARHKENSFGQDVVCFECNKCGEYKLPIIHTMITEPLGVCPNCGVNMQKGGAK